MFDSDDPKTVPVNVRFTDAQIERFDAAWRAEGFASRSAYLRHLATRAIGEPSAAPALTEALNGVSKQLARIGRNVNQAVREMHRQRKMGALAPDARPSLEDLEALHGVLKDVERLADRVVASSGKPKRRRRRT